MLNILYLYRKVFAKLSLILQRFRRHKLSKGEDGQEEKERRRKGGRETMNGWSIMCGPWKVTSSFPFPPSCTPSGSKTGVLFKCINYKSVSTTE